MFGRCVCGNVDSLRVLQLDLPISWDLVVALLGSGTPRAVNVENILCGIESLISRVHLRSIYPDDMFAALCGMQEVC